MHIRLKNVQKCKNRAARVVTGKSYDVETSLLSYCCKTCSLKGKIVIEISAEMRSTLLSSEVLAIENKLKLSENACLTMNAYCILHI